MRMLQKIDTKKDLSSAGFSLLEVMVAMSIIAIVITAVFRMQSQSIVMNNEARFYVTSPLLAQKVMAEYEKDTDKSENASGVFEEAFSNYSWKRTIEEVEIDSLGESEDDTQKPDDLGFKGEEVEGLKKIDVTILYNEGELAYGIRTYRYVPGEEG